MLLPASAQDDQIGVLVLHPQNWYRAFILRTINDRPTDTEYHSSCINICRRQIYHRASKMHTSYAEGVLHSAQPSSLARSANFTAKPCPASPCFPLQSQVRYSGEDAAASSRYVRQCIIFSVSLHRRLPPRAHGASPIYANRTHSPLSAPKIVNFLKTFKNFPLPYGNLYLYMV